jgi:uncharacterized protein (TIGR02391 family)
VETWPPTAEDVEGLPVDALGIRLLGHISDSGKTTLNNVGANLRASHSTTLTQKHQPMIGEAWHWLVSNGLITEIPMESGWFIPSRLGEKLLKDPLEDAIQHVHAEQRISLDLHPRIQSSVRSQFLLNEYDAAVFIAMRTVEERVRDIAKADNSEVGVKLMRRVFGADGPLRDDQVDAGEGDAQMALFWGAIGFFKNPASHRRIDYENATEASEAVLLADLLLRILDRIEADTS